MKEKKNRFKERASGVDKDIKREIDLSFYAAKAIRKQLKDKNMTQKDLSISLGLKESQISKWLTGMHNFTFSTIAKIETALDFRIIHDKPIIRQVIVYKTVESSINAHINIGMSVGMGGIFPVVDTGVSTSLEAPESFFQSRVYHLNPKPYCLPLK